MRALWLVNQLWFIVPVNSWKLRVSSKLSYLRLQYFFHNRNAVEVGSVIREAYRLQDSTPAEVNPKRMLQPFSPLTRAQYPIFNKYPKFVVDYQVNWKLRKILREKFHFDKVARFDTWIGVELRHQFEI